MTRTAAPSWWQNLLRKSSTRSQRRLARKCRPCLLPLEGRIVPSRIVANDDFTDTDGNNPVQILELENDQAVGTTIDPTTVQIVTNPTHGTTSIDPATGDITYTATGNFMGTDTLQYRVFGADHSPSTIGTITVVVNRPTANDDQADTDGTNPVTVDVLANDTDPDGNNMLDPATVTVVSGPSHGQVSVNHTTGAITYTANAGFGSTDFFQYTVTDVNGAVSNAATVTISVHVPKANDDFASTTGTTPVVIDVLGNDTDPDGNNMLDPASVTVVSAPAHGKATVDTTTGAITYTANAGFAGTDKLQYTVADVNGAVSSPGTVTITVSAVAPQANDDAADTDGTNPVAVDVLANDSDPNSSPLVPSTVTVVSGPANGQVSVNQTNGEITYTANAGFGGTDSFKYTVKDQLGFTSNQATVTVVVNYPTANDDQADTDGTNPVTVDVLANDTDPDGNNMLDPATVTVVSGPSNGHVTVDHSTGAITYTANANFGSTDSFRYTVADVNGAVSNAATVTIAIHRPTANDDVADTDGTNPVTVAVLANDTDPDGNNMLDPASVVVVSGPSHGQASVNSTTGDITYTAAAGFAGTDSFRYTVTDFPGAVSNEATVTIIVNRPTALDDAATTVQGKAVDIAVLANDTDPDGNNMIDPSSVTIVSGPSHGTASVNHTTGVVTYTPAGMFTGDDTFTYTVADFPGAVSNVATVRIHVSAVPANKVFATGAGVGALPTVNVYNEDGTLKTSFAAYGAGFAGGVRVAVGDVTGDGIPDIITAAGPGGGPLVKVFSGADFSLVSAFYAYSPTFAGGVNIAVGDVNGDGTPDIITGAGTGGGPHVKVFDGVTGSVIRSFYAYSVGFGGGVNVAAGDVTGDGVADIITGAGAGGGPHVKVFDGASLNLYQSFYAYSASFGGGVAVAAADLDGDGFADVITGAGSSGGPHVKVFSGADNSVLRSFYAFNAGFGGGVRVGAEDLNGDGTPDILVAAGPTGGPHVRAFDGTNGTTLENFYAYDPSFLGGVYVGGN